MPTQLATLTLVVANANAPRRHNTTAVSGVHDACDAIADYPGREEKYYTTIMQSRARRACVRKLAVRSDRHLRTSFVFVRPFQLHGITTVLPGLPRANVANLAIVVVVPALTGYRISDRLTQLM